MTSAIVLKLAVKNGGKIQSHLYNHEKRDHDPKNRMSLSRRLRLLQMPVDRHLKSQNKSYQHDYECRKCQKSVQHDPMS